jgi:pSer/pThr/pTyr-binding forkhead associated (FHA) protein
MHVSLIVEGGVHAGRVIPIQVPEFRIGRDTNCHLRPASEDVSREHCAIVIRPDHRVFLKDFGSRNGTILNHRMLVHGEVQLEHGDLIEVGPLIFKIAITDAPEPASRAQRDGEDIHDDEILSVLTENQEPSTEETIQVSRPRLAPPGVPLKDAGPRIVND